MTKEISNLSSVLLVLLSAAAAFLYAAELHRAPFVFGVGRQPASTVIANADDFHVIADTVHCEDLHHHEPSNLLFSACEGVESTRYGWFPGLGHYDDPNAGLKGQGALHAIDPSTMKAKKLKFTNFNGPFITHGIDVIDDPDKAKGEAVYIFAINHIPSPQYSEDRKTKHHKARSIIEVFHHVIGSDTVQHLRSVWDPLITTPNDIVATSPTSFFVTNDHYYREGLLRSIEDIWYGAKWSNTIYVEFTELTDGSFRDDDHGVKAAVALDRMHNNNGLGHGRTPSEVLVVGCTSGRVHVGNIVPATAGKGFPTIRINETLSFESIVDNPSWFRDPYATDKYDASGLLAPGLTRAIDLLENAKDPQGKDGVMVWKASPVINKVSSESAKNQKRWSTQLLFEDDSTRIRTASAAVLVAIDPAKEKGKRKGWLFVTGFLSKSMIAVKVDL